MALAPRFAGHRFIPGAGSGAAALSSSKTPLHTIELYLDYVCPYSLKLYNTLYHSVFPALSKQSPPKVEFIFRQQIQPWHPASTLTHEAGVAVVRVKPEKFWEFSAALFDDAKSYYDVNVVNETRNQTYKRLAALAASSTGASESEIYDLLAVPDKPAPDGSLNIGNAVTKDLTVLTKINRRVGAHVTPTVVFNGVIENEISSSFTKEDWEKWLEKNIV